MSISKEEREKLRRAAESATVGKPNGKASFVEYFESGERHKLLDVVAWEFEATNIHIGDFKFFLHFSPETCLELLDALEAEERVTAGLKVMLKTAKARAEASERERNVLAQELDMRGCPSMGESGFKTPNCDKDPATFLHDSQQCWLEWARQQARGGEI